MRIIEYMINKIKRWLFPAPFRVIQKWDGTYRAQRHIYTSKFHGALYSDITTTAFTSVFDADACIHNYIETKKAIKVAKEREEQYKLIADVYEQNH